MFTLRVPASSANLGPGFDALGLALGVYLTCRFRRSDALSITATGRDAVSIPTNPDNLIWQTALTVARDHRTQNASTDRRTLCPERGSNQRYVTWGKITPLPPDCRSKLS